MKICLVFLILLLIFNSIEAQTEVECMSLKRYCTPPCRGGKGCMYNVSLYLMNCQRYKLNCPKE